MTGPLANVAVNGPVVPPRCDHAYGSRLRGGEPVCVRICSLCSGIDWDDLRRSVLDYANQQTAKALRDAADDYGLPLIDAVWLRTRADALTATTEGPQA